MRRRLPAPSARPWRAVPARLTSPTSTRLWLPPARASAPGTRDSVASHDKFKKKHDLPFILASDADGNVTEKYGVWVEKSMYGRKYMGIDRSTFLIDKDGVVRNIWHKVKVPGHVAEVLKAAKAL